MRGAAERHVLTQVLARGVEAIRVRKEALVSVGRSEHHPEQRSLRDLDALELRVLGDQPEQPLVGARHAQRLFDHGGDRLRVLADALPLLRILDQELHRFVEELGRGLVARHHQQLDDADQLAHLEWPQLSGVVLELGLDQI